VRSPARWRRRERRAILDVLHSERFADTAPAEAWAVLLDVSSHSNCSFD
jgi:hypothetical protein